MAALSKQYIYRKIKDKSTADRLLDMLDQKDPMVCFDADDVSAILSQGDRFVFLEGSESILARITGSALVIGAILFIDDAKDRPIEQILRFGERLVSRFPEGAKVTWGLKYKATLKASRIRVLIAYRYYKDAVRS